jgi:hypothetical protein
MTKNEQAKFLAKMDRQSAWLSTEDGSSLKDEDKITTRTLALYEAFHQFVKLGWCYEGRKGAENAKRAIKALNDNGHEMQDGWITLLPKAFEEDEEEEGDGEDGDGEEEAEAEAEEEGDGRRRRRRCRRRGRRWRRGLTGRGSRGSRASRWHHLLRGLRALEALQGSGGLLSGISIPPRGGTRLHRRGHRGRRRRRRRRS